MLCPKCGKQLPDDAKFCRDCGSRIEIGDEGTEVKAQTPTLAQLTEETTGNNEKRVSKKQAVIITVSIAIVILLAVAIGLYVKTTADRNQALADSVESPFSEQYNGITSFQGCASNDFVTESKYEVSDYSMKNIKLDGDHMTGTIEATLSNEFFSSKVTCQVGASIDDEGNLSDISFEPLEATQTKAVSGITHDDENGIKNASSSFDSEKSTCSVEHVKASGDSVNTWFLVSGNEETCYYAFDGSKWTFENADEGEAVKQFSTDINGTYSGKGAWAPSAATVTISNLDASSGKVDISWKLPYSDGNKTWPGYYKKTISGSASGKTTATINQSGGNWGLDLLDTDGETEGNSDAYVRLRLTFKTDGTGFTVSEMYPNINDQSHWGFMVVLKSGVKGYNDIALDETDFFAPTSLKKTS